MENPCAFSADDLGRFQRFVASRCPARMGWHDREDLASDILLDAVVAQQKTGGPLVPLAFHIAKRARYYVRASERVAASGLLAGDDGMVELAVEDDPTEDVCTTDLVQRLPDNERRAFVLLSVERATIAETSVLLGRPRSTVRRDGRRACTSLRMAWFEAVAA